jgi:hypothetical protein
METLLAFTFFSTFAIVATVVCALGVFIYRITRPPKPCSWGRPGRSACRSSKPSRGPVNRAVPYVTYD